MRTSTAVHGLWRTDVIGVWIRFIRFMEQAAGPVVDLLIRFWLGQAFFVSGILKLSDWNNALALARYEYPVSWMNPVTAASLGVAIEVICPVLLVLGLATRFAGMSLFILSLVIQTSYKAFDIQLFWMILAAWYVMRGAGAISLDRALARGLQESAIPFGRTAIRITSWITTHLAPVYQLFMRLWLASGLMITGWWYLNDAGLLSSARFESLGQWLPLQTLVSLTGVVSLSCAFLLALGFVTRIAALCLMVLALTIMMQDNSVMINSQWLMLLLTLYAVFGAGRWSLDTQLYLTLRRIYPQLDDKPAFSLQGLPQVVIIGAGFGGVSCARALRRSPVAVTLVDRHNYHLFQPLLYQVATTALAPGDIAMPIRGLFRDQFNARVLLGEVTGIDTGRKEVLIGDHRLAYDFLVLASGASHSYFGRDEWGQFAPGLKRIEDATEVRRRVLLAFEHAENTDDPDERQALLTFLIVGGGPTGVELAGAIAELARFGMEKDFRRFDPATARVMLVQSAPRILPAFAESLSARAETSLRRLGVEILTGSRVEHIDAHGVLISGNRIAARTVLWAAGVVASPAARWLDADADSAGRLKVGADLSVPGLPNVFAVGDTALSSAWKGNPVPGLAPAAKQGGAYVARVIRARIAGKPVPPAFHYLHLGSLATIGRKAAVADFNWLRLSGTPAWWLWGAIHVYFLAGLRNRVSVMFDWIWAYLTFRSSTRLITETYRQPEEITEQQSAATFTRRAQHG